MVEPLLSENTASKAKVISDLGIDLLICGAISSFLSNMIAAYGILIIPFVTGKVNEVLNAYAKGKLQNPVIQFPIRAHTSRCGGANR